MWWNTTVVKSSELLEGAVDIHAHSSPDCFERMFRHDELAQHANDYGLDGIVLKCHHHGTADRVPFVEELVDGINVYGSLTLNHPVGGLNPAAVETAIEYGARQVWMPTIDARSHAEHYGKSGEYDRGLPIAWERRVHKEPMTVLEDGELKPNVVEIVELLADDDILLSVGHLSYEEIVVLLEAADDAGLEKTVVDHPNISFMDFSLEQQEELIGLGAKMNYVCAELSARWHSLSPEEFAANIRELGVDNVVISSDGGQISNPPPCEMLRTTIQLLLEEGFSEAEIKMLFEENPKELVA